MNRRTFIGGTLIIIAAPLWFITRETQLNPEQRVLLERDLTYGFKISPKLNKEILYFYAGIKTKQISTPLYQIYLENLHLFRNIDTKNEGTAFYYQDQNLQEIY